MWTVSYAQMILQTLRNAAVPVCTTIHLLWSSVAVGMPALVSLHVSKELVFFFQGLFTCVIIYSEHPVQAGLA